MTVNEPAKFKRKTYTTCSFKHVRQKLASKVRSISFMHFPTIHEEQLCFLPQRRIIGVSTLLIEEVL